VPKVAPEVPDEGAVWSAQDTSTGDIEAALRRLLQQQHARDHAHAPARVLNLVVVVDREWRGEIMNRLEQVGHYHASRTILCTVERGRTTLDAEVVLTIEGERQPGDIGLTRERVSVAVGEKHLDKLDTIVDPLVVTDLPTVVWSPHGHREAVDALLGIAQVVLLDSVDEPELRDALQRAHTLRQRAYVVDLAWLRSTPWRERVAATFDPPHLRPELRTLSTVRVRHHPDSAAAGLLLVGWLASRLAWRVSPLMARDGTLVGSAHSRRQDVQIQLEPVPDLNVRGLAGVTVGTASGRELSLDRGPGGLQAHYRNAKGDDRRWTVLGASRGEAGILGEGIRQAMLRDPIYGPALESASALVP
jgi:glucose-6-phosphate dehydrogenase assembly protein OpcA